VAGWSPRSALVMESAAAALRLVQAYADAPGFEAVNRAMRAGSFTRLEHIRVPVTLA